MKRMSKLNVDKEHRLFVKNINKKEKKEDIVNFYSELWGRVGRYFQGLHRSNGETEKNTKGMSAADASTIRSLCLKKYHSFYVYDESVVDFVKNAPLNENDMKQMHGIAIQFVEKYKKYGMVVHMAGESQSILFSFSPSDMLIDPETRKAGIKGFPVFHKRFCKGESADVGYIAVSEDSGVIGGKLVNEKKEAGSDIWRIFFNLCMYMSAFPECVMDGAPPVKVDGSRERSTTVKASEQIKHVYRDGVSPHMRRGHFRFLKSEKYKNKRFQAIYVKPTMVKGKSNTVVGPEHGETP